MSLFCRKECFSFLRKKLLCKPYNTSSAFSMTSKNIKSYSTFVTRGYFSRKPLNHKIFSPACNNFFYHTSSNTLKNNGNSNNNNNNNNTNNDNGAIDNKVNTGKYNLDPELKSLLSSEEIADIIKEVEKIDKVDYNIETELQKTQKLEYFDAGELDLDPPDIEPPSVSFERAKEIFEKVCPLLIDCKCKALVGINISGRHERAHFFAIVTILSNRHSKAVADSVKELGKELNLKKNEIGIEGEFDQWTIIELAGVHVHLLDASTRQSVELEKLWTLGKFDDQMHEMLVDPVELSSRGKRNRVRYSYGEVATTKNNGSSKPDF